MYVNMHNFVKKRGFTVYFWVTKTYSVLFVCLASQQAHKQSLFIFIPEKVHTHIFSCLFLVYVDSACLVSIVILSVFLLNCAHRDACKQLIQQRTKTQTWPD